MNAYTGGNGRRLAYLGLLIALCVVGACIKIPSITGTPALDAAPGYFAALALGGGSGALVAGAGHLLTALTAGFPLGVIHVLIACGMAGCAAAVAWLRRRAGLGAAVGGGILLNGIVFPGLFLPLPGFGTAFFLAMVVPLLVASAINVGLAAAVWAALGRGRVSVGRRSVRPG